MKKSIVTGLILSLMVLVFACAQQSQEQTPTQKTPALDADKVVEKVVVSEQNPSLKIISPKDSELVKDSKIAVIVQPENFKVVPIESPVKAGEGHFHIWLDSGKKVTTASTVTFENIVSGRHQIVA